MKTRILVIIVIICLVANSYVYAQGAINSVKTSAGITIDGNLNEWTSSDTIILDTSYYIDYTQASNGDADISAEVYTMWNNDNAYLAVQVTDDVHYNSYSGIEIWRGDSVQFAFDTDHDATPYYDDDGDFEYGYALTNTGAQVYRWKIPSANPPENSEYAIVRNGTITTYEIRIPKEDLAPLVLEEGNIIGFSVMINDNEGSSERDGWLEWTPGIGYTKDPSQYGDLVFIVNTSTARTTKLWYPYAEWRFNNPTWSGNAFDVQAQAVFSDSRSPHLFYDGGTTWKLRYMCTEVGTFSFTTSSSDPELNGLTGNVTCEDNSGAMAS